MNNKRIENIKNYVEKEMKDLCISHDFFHIQRVVENAKKIYSWEKQWNIELIIWWAYLHESLDEKFFHNTEKRKKQLSIFLQEIWYDISEVNKILFIADNVGFWKSLERKEDFNWSIEFQIVEDADRLEWVWAINIARTFSYGGKKWRIIYDPNISPVSMWNDNEYRINSQKSTSFNHFYEKILLLKNLMHTKTWRKLVEQRHKFTEKFLKQFLDEWEWIK